MKTALGAMNSGVLAGAGTHHSFDRRRIGDVMLDYIIECCQAALLLQAL